MCQTILAQENFVGKQLFTEDVNIIVKLTIYRFQIKMDYVFPIWPWRGFRLIRDRPVMTNFQDSDPIK